jgi:hypothetical protein
MRAGFDLQPLMFTGDEVEAIVVGLGLLKRTGDTGLQGCGEASFIEDNFCATGSWTKVDSYQHSPRLQPG